MTAQYNQLHITTDDFQTLSPHVHRLILPFSIPLLPSIPVSVFLVQNTQSSDYYLIDTGPIGSELVIIKALAKFFDKDVGDEGHASILNSTVKGVILTHYHLDHCGSLRALYEMSNKELVLSSHEDEIDFFAMENPKVKNVKSDNWVFPIANKFMKQPNLGVPTQSHDMIMGSYYSNGKKSPIQSVSSNDATSTTNKKDCSSLKSCHCPGHTPGHCCFLHEEDRVLIGSDLILNLTGKFEYSPKALTPHITKSIQNTKNLVNDIKGQVDYWFPSHDISENGLSMDKVVDFIDNN